ncbi:hypothetical protein [Paenibacillus donghaensis]|uniref:Uncharacterized protein n=1 Tax=Paenibacillus donghaensis TaxID=414771 RepID=A0A2Z2KH50_9BACL|nr:hypothetical protein [Paenibacillus donghaensis]ASA22563.1 hypothetical protein B9T62_18305 [Paenibacillus donghaensis]
MEIVARARLRPDKDEDLIKAFEQLPKHKDRSDVVREALRLMFSGGDRIRSKGVVVDSEVFELNTATESIPDEVLDNSIDEFLLGI